MIQKYLIKVLCTQSGEICGHAGVELHGLFFNLLKLENKELANSLHELQQKPFSISPLTGDIHRSNKKAWVKEGGVYYFAISSISDELTQILPEILKKIEGNLITIGKAEFIVCQFSYLLPKGTSFFTILSENQITSKIHFQFLSPTCFRSHDRWMLFPDPHIVFNGLWEKWNVFSETPLPPIDPSFLIVTKYNLKTAMTQLGSFDIIGFLGDCVYLLDQDTPETTKWMFNALAHFASIMGVGYKTTMGMGQVKINF